MILSAKQKQRHRRREQTYEHQKEKGGDGMNWETEVDIYILVILRIYTMYRQYKQVTNENILYSTGNSTQGSVVT